MSYLELLTAARGQTWAIQPSFLEAALAEARRGEVNRQARLPRVDGSVAVLAIDGPITQKGSIFDEIFGGTAVESFEAAFARAVNSDRVKAIILDTNSPGGTVSGVAAAANRVFDARDKKPIVAISNSLNASAAYWISSSAKTLVAAQGSDTGSIGAFRLHQDVSKALEKDGVKMTFIAVPEFKVEGNPFEELSEEALAHHTDQVQDTFRSFNKSVARNRGVSESAAREGFGKGRMFHASQAVSLGMVDRVASLQDLLRELGVGRSATATRADAEITEELCAAWESGVVEHVVADDIITPIPTDKLRRRLDIKEREVNAG